MTYFLSIFPAYAEEDDVVNNAETCGMFLHGQYDGDDTSGTCTIGESQTVTIYPGHDLIIYSNITVVSLGTIIVQNGGVLIIRGNFNNYNLVNTVGTGSIGNFGDFDNEGTLNTNHDFENYGGTISNGGTINNHGSFNVATTLDNEGAFLNYVSVDIFVGGGGVFRGESIYNVCGGNVTPSTIPQITIACSGLTADAGKLQVVNGGDMVTLDGSKSTDSSGGTFTYSWTQLTTSSGPTVTLKEANTAHPTFVAPPPTSSDQTLKFSLTISDGTETSAPAYVTMVVKPHFPIIFLPGVGGTRLFFNSVSSSNEVWPIPIVRSPLYMSMHSDGSSIASLIPNGILDYDVTVTLPTGILGGTITIPVSDKTNFYESMINYLESEKEYVPDQDLFLFPYDWRMANENHWYDLDNLIQQALSMQTQPIPQTQVILVAHSQGGLIARSYLQSGLPHVVNVNSTITMGTPYWGSLKTYYALIHGYDFDNPVVGTFRGGLIALKCVAQHVPAVYELLPEKSFIYEKNYLSNNSTLHVYNNYFTPIDLGTSFTSLRYNGVDTTKLHFTPSIYGNGVGCPDYYPSGGWLWAPDITLYNNANLFYSNYFGTYESPLKLSSQVKQYVIIGVGVQTLSSYILQPVSDGSSTNSILVNGQTAQLIPVSGDGDGTVPLWSAENVPDATHKYYVEYTGTGTQSSEHANLPNNSETQQIMGQIIDGNAPSDSAYPYLGNTPIKPSDLRDVSSYQIP